MWATTGHCIATWLKVTVTLGVLVLIAGFVWGFHSNAFVLAVLAAIVIDLIAMKAAHAVATHHKPLQPVPEWRVRKVERIVPGPWKAPQKAYLWALHNPHISAVISNLWDETHVRENLALAGKTIELQPG